MRIKTCLALAIAGALSVSAAFATTLTEMNLNAMAKQATVAVVGKVTGSRTIDTDNGLATITTFEVEKSAWGAAVGQTLEVLTPGGSTTRGKFPIGETVAGSPQMYMDTKSLLMLTQDSSSGAFVIVGFNQGNLQVVNNAQLGEAVLLPGSRSLLPIEQAMTEIKEARAAASEEPAR